MYAYLEFYKKQYLHETKINNVCNKFDCLANTINFLKTE